MGDMDKQIEKLGQVLNEAAKKPPKMPLRRHHDDDYWDRIDVSAEGASLRVYIVPRYKTSGMSGDEWRISAVLDVFAGPSIGEPDFTWRSHRMRTLLQYAPHHLYANVRHLFDCKNAVLIVQRKGIELMRQSFPTFGDAAIGMAWHITIANEGSREVEWYHLSNDEERARCQQVGCSEPPKNVYRLKKLQIVPSESDMRAPRYDFEGQFTWFCSRHTERGDCGMEDADDNLELVSGSGVPVTHAADESPSAFGDVVHVEAPDGIASPPSAAKEPGT